MKVYLKQLFFAALVLCTLGYSSAWAFDEHAFDKHVNERANDSLEIELISLDVNLLHQQLLPQQLSHQQLSHQQNEADGACDHCCHISSHLVAIFSDARCLSTVSTSVYVLNSTDSVLPFAISPDRRPPRV